MMSRKGILVVLSGFSGSGKGTIVNRLLEKYDNYALSISATTRKPREGETEGISYFFKTREEFERMIKQDAFIEYAKYVNNYYGTPKNYVKQNLKAGKDVILEIEIQGAMKVKEKYPDTVLMFVTPPDTATLKERLLCRGTETEEKIHSRLLRAVEESNGIEDYDYLIINNELEACVDEMHAIIQCEHDKVKRNTAFIETIKRDLKTMSKGE